MLANIFIDIKNMFILLLLGIIMYLGIANYQAKNTINENKITILSQKTTIDNYIASSKQAEKELKEAKVKSQETIIKIQKVYIPKLQYIKEFVKDKNETECEASERLIDSTVY